MIANKIQVQLRPLAASYEAAMQEQSKAYNLILRELTETGNVSQAYMFIGEHLPVYTIGLHGKLTNLLCKEGEGKIPHLYRTNRGGDITYHGPGQIVLYFVAHLPTLGLGARRYVEILEHSVIDTLATFHIDANILEDAPGVWLLPTATKPLRKICALGIHINRGIATHGLALNVQTKLSYFSHINPCGFTDRGVTSMLQELTTPIDLVLVKDMLLQHLARELKLSYTLKDGAITKR